MNINSYWSSAKFTSQTPNSIIELPDTKSTKIIFTLVVDFIMDVHGTN